MSFVTTTYFRSLHPISPTSSGPLRNLRVFATFLDSLQYGACPTCTVMFFKTSQAAIGLTAPTAHKTLTLTESDVTTSISKTRVFSSNSVDRLLRPTYSVSLNTHTILLRPKTYTPDSPYCSIPAPNPVDHWLEKKSLQQSYFYLAIKV